MKKDNPTNGELAIMIENLTKLVEGVHSKQDYTNGKVSTLLEFKSKSEKDIGKIEGMEKDIQQAKGTINFLKWIGATGLIGILTAVVNSMK